MRILMSGGHLTPAVAMIDFIKQYQPKDELVFVGREYSQDKLKQKALEQEVVTQRKVKFVAFRAVRLVGLSGLEKLTIIPSFIKSIWRARCLINRLKPDVFLSFGGYLAVPLAIAARLSRVPIVTHEQTRATGLANRLIAKLAQKVAISYPESSSFFPAAKTVLTGNPVRKRVFAAGLARPEWMEAKRSRPILIILGGNQGSKIINETVEASLPQLLQSWHVVHQCGRPTTEDNYKDRLEAVRSEFSEVMQSRYVVREWIKEKELGWLYRHAKLAISRAGANTVQELALAKLPSILIPLPFSYNQEQLKNAQWLAQAGGAFLLEQSGLNRESLEQAINKITDSLPIVLEHLEEIKLDTQADSKLYQVLVEVTTQAHGN